MPGVEGIGEARGIPGEELVQPQDLELPPGALDKHPSGLGGVHLPADGDRLLDPDPGKVGGGDDADRHVQTPVRVHFDTADPDQRGGADEDALPPRRYAPVGPDGAQGHLGVAGGGKRVVDKGIRPGEVGYSIPVEVPLVADRTGGARLTGGERHCLSHRWVIGRWVEIDPLPEHSKAQHHEYSA